MSRGTFPISETDLTVSLQYLVHSHLITIRSNEIVMKHEIELAIAIIFIALFAILTVSDRFSFSEPFAVLSAASKEAHAVTVQLSEPESMNVDGETFSKIVEFVHLKYEKMPSQSDGNGQEEQMLDEFLSLEPELVAKIAKVSLTVRVGFLDIAQHP